jgi:hypothetical protein
VFNSPFFVVRKSNVFSFQNFVSLVAKEFITFGRSLEMTFWQEPLLLLWSWTNSGRWRHYFYFYLEAMLWNGGGIALGSISRKQHWDGGIAIIYSHPKSMFCAICSNFNWEWLSFLFNGFEFHSSKNHANMNFLW